MYKLTAAIWISVGLCANTGLANNGPNLIGVSPQSIGMGGTGTANYTTGLTALYKNPATLSQSVEKTGTLVGEFSIGAISENASADAGTGAGVKASSAPLRFIPDLAFTYKIDEMFNVGFGIMGIAGSSVDYVYQSELAQLGSTFNLVKFVPVFSFSPVPWFSFGAGPYMNYGELSLNYQDATGIASGRQPHGAVSFGEEVGVTFRVDEKLRFGASFITASAATYPVIAQFDLFGPNGGSPAPINDLTVTQPWELSVGAVAELCPELKVTLDYRRIAWDQVDPYKSLGWGGQNVFSFGAQLMVEKLAVRAGYSFSPSFIANTTGETGVSTVQFSGREVFMKSVSTLDATVFPGFTQHHITAGVGYPVLENLVVDAAAFWAPTSTLTRSGSLGPSNYNVTGNISLWSATVSANYAF